MDTNYHLESMNTNYHITTLGVQLIDILAKQGKTITILLTPIIFIHMSLEQEY